MIFFCEVNTLFVVLSNDDDITNKTFRRNDKLQLSCNCNRTYSVGLVRKTRACFSVKAAQCLVFV